MASGKDVPFLDLFLVGRTPWRAIGQEIGRLMQAVGGVEAEIDALEALEPGEIHGLLQ